MGSIVGSQEHLGKLTIPVPFVVNIKTVLRQRKTDIDREKDIQANTFIIRTYKATKTNTHPC